MGGMGIFDLWAFVLYISLSLRYFIFLLTNRRFMVLLLYGGELDGRIKEVVVVYIR